MRRSTPHALPAAWAASALVASLAGCGYQPVHAQVPAGARLHVHLARALIAAPLAADEVLSGVREELSRRGALAPGDGYPRVEVEVLRADETSEGVAAPLDNGVRTPVARATELGLVARAWVIETVSSPPTRDTGDVGAMDAVASGAPSGGSSALGEGGSATSFASAREIFLHDEATLAVARRLGVRLAQHVLAAPAVVAEGVGRER